MGYDLHITRRVNWADPQGPAITQAEWTGLIKDDPELKPSRDLGAGYADWTPPHAAEATGWLQWADGNVHSKNPDKALIIKMGRLAARLGAQVQGDDGERYGPDGEAIPDNRTDPQPRRKRGFLASLLQGLASRPRAATSVFQVGDRVWSVVRQCPCTVISVEPERSPPLGSITVRFDTGETLSSALVASGLEPLGGRAP